MAGISDTYIPGVKFAATKGLTVDDFESRSVEKAVPVHEAHPGWGSGDTLVTTNFSGEQCFVCIDNYPQTNAKFPNERWNNTEVDCVPIGPGRSIFFNLGPCFYRLSVHDVVISEKCKQYFETDTGINFTTLVNSDVVFVPAAVSNEWDVIVTQSQNEGWTAISNHGDVNLELTYSRIKPHIFLTNSELENIRKSRTPDDGPQVLKKFTIKPGCTKWLRTPRRTFTVRWLQYPNDDDDVSLVCDSPNVDDYTEITNNIARTGDVSGLFVSGDGRGFEGAVYSQRICKPVSSDLVTTRNIHGL